MSLIKTSFRVNSRNIIYLFVVMSLCGLSFFSCSPKKSVSISYPAFGSKGEFITVEYPWDVIWLLYNCYEYNHDLAKIMSVQIGRASCR